MSFTYYERATIAQLFLPVSIGRETPGKELEAKVGFSGEALESISQRGLIICYEAHAGIVGEELKGHGYEIDYITHY